MRIELQKKILYRESEMTALDLELEELTARDILSVEKDLKLAGENVAAWEYSRGFLLAVASKASHVPIEVLNTLSVPDFTNVINSVLSFFAGTAMAE